MAQTVKSLKVMKGISSQAIAILAFGVVMVDSFSIMSRLLIKEYFD